ncbi:hypothetical protein AUC69_01885 [Methyloceanibacter superfactus]|uniref:Uncharacterized protein n=1 Tax=Methyloceanibacter superfactus TaxID=1774969 RepID=A0A1E3VR57_9HYPH|nr:hypothetical protein AUC69_01885 [Methyloceanibacter superfactus]
MAASGAASPSLGASLGSSFASASGSSFGWSFGSAFASFAAVSATLVSAVRDVISQSRPPDMTIKDQARKAIPIATTMMVSALSMGVSLSLLMGLLRAGLARRLFHPRKRRPAPTVPHIGP